MPGRVWGYPLKFNLTSPQHGHRGSLLAIARAMSTRSVEIESGTWRCTRPAAARDVTSRPEVVRQVFSEGSWSPARGSTHTGLPNDLLSFEGRAAYIPRTLWSRGIGRRPFTKRRMSGPNIMRPPGGLPTAGQRHGRERRPAGRPWTTRDITSNAGNPPIRNPTASPSTGTGYPASPRFLRSGEPRFLNALR
jgi:hypothetical protein